MYIYYIMQINTTEVLGKCKTCAILRNRIPIKPHQARGLFSSPQRLTFTSSRYTCEEKLTKNFMVCDDSFSCAIRGKTLRSRGDAVCFYSDALPKLRRIQG